MFSDGFNKLSNWFDATFKSRGPPLFEESVRSPWSFEIPKSIEFIFQNPGPVNTAVAFSQRIKEFGLSFGPF